MKTSIETLARLLATVAWVDGEYTESEKECLTEIAEALELNADELTKTVDAAVEQVKTADEDAANDYMLAAAAQVDSSEAKVVMEALLEMVLADSVVARAEVETLLSLGDALGLDTVETVLLLTDMVRDTECFEVEI